MHDDINLTIKNLDGKIPQKVNNDHDDDCDKTATDLESDIEGDTDSAVRDVPGRRRIVVTIIVILSFLMVASAMIGAAVGSGAFSRDDTSNVAAGGDDQTSAVLVDNQNDPTTIKDPSIEDTLVDERFDADNVDDIDSNTGRPLPGSTATQTDTDAAAELPTQTSWPELVGRTGVGAKKMIESKYPDIFDVVIVVDGTPLTRDYRQTRVRIVVNEEDGIVVRTPHVG